MILETTGSTESWLQTCIAHTDEPIGVAYVEAGARACPPEDVGGSSEYGHFVECIQKDRNSDESRQLLDWACIDFNPEQFDRHATNCCPAAYGLESVGWKITRYMPRPKR